MKKTVYKSEALLSDGCKKSFQGNIKANYMLNGWSPCQYLKNNKHFEITYCSHGGVIFIRIYNKRGDNGKALIDRVLSKHKDQNIFNPNRIKSMPSIEYNPDHFMSDLEIEYRPTVRIDEYDLAKIIYDEFILA